MSTEGTEEALKGTMRKEVVYRSVLCNTMHKQNLTLHFKFVKARSVLDSSHTLEVLLNVKLVYFVHVCTVHQQY